MARKKKRKQLAADFTEDGIPVDPCAWTVEDWRALHIAMEAARAKISDNHKQEYEEQRNE